MILSLLVAIPLTAALIVALLPRHAAGGVATAKAITLGVSVLTLGMALFVAAQYLDHGRRDGLAETYTWIAPLGANIAWSINGISLTLILLAAILFPVVVLAAFDETFEGRRNHHSYFAWLLTLQGLAFAVFAANDVFLFYIVFEATLVPIYFLIGSYGGARRSYAAMKFLVFNFAGGLIMLFSVIGLYVISARTEGGPSLLFEDVAALGLDGSEGRWLFVGFFIAFAIKAPLWPLHTWLPDAAAAAKPGTSVLMVSVVDKIGTYGMVTLCISLFPEAAKWAAPVVITLAVISVLYGALLAIGQQDLLRLIAYTSVSHFGFIIIGIFAFTQTATAGATLYMFNHGLSTAALFLIAAVLIKRRGTADISAYGGVQKAAPVLSGIFLIAGLSSLSLPGLSPFVSEFLVLVGTFPVYKVAAVVATLGIVLAALYILIAYQRIMTGPPTEHTANFRDVGVRETVVFAPLIGLIIALGFVPQPMLNIINPTVEEHLEHVGQTDPPPVQGEQTIQLNAGGDE